MNAYRDLRVYFGDLHSHCGISYGHGSLDEALANAREQLDFCSVTGHAHWPDMPPPDPRIQHILDFHHEGFAKLKAGWPAVLATLRQANEEGRFVVFPSFEIHFCATGDRTVLYRDLEGDILYADGLADLHRRLRALAAQGEAAIAFPHHLGYRRGARGINWDTFDPTFAPVVEIVSMHGCSEGSENPRPFLHSMGPSDWESTMQFGLAQGHVFGVVGGTDHHSAHPGSYGHGRAALWAAGLTREALWEALMARRTCALTGDRIAVQFALNDAPMGALVPLARQRHIEIRVEAGGAIDCVDLVKNNRLLRRWSECDVPQAAPADLLHTKLFLEVGWGEKRKETAWEVSLGISEGRILAVEPRFRGQEVVSPIEQEADSSSGYYHSHWERDGERAVRFTTRSTGHPNNVTNAAQGMCLEVEVPLGGAVEAALNGQRVSVPLRRLLAGAKSGNLGGIDSPAWRLHRAPLPWEYCWNVSLDDADDAPAFYYVRVRQKSDQWAWTSPIFVR
jgi:hypothetical protein